MGSLLFFTAGADAGGSAKKRPAIYFEIKVRKQMNYKRPSPSTIAWNWLNRLVAFEELNRVRASYIGICWFSK